MMKNGNSHTLVFVTLENILALFYIRENANTIQPCDSIAYVDKLEKILHVSRKR